MELGLATQLLSESADGVGYLLKDRIGDVQEFVAAVRRIADGGSPSTPDHQRAVEAASCDDPLAQLTPREHGVLELMASGSSNQGIAESLSLSLRAVEKYVSRIFDKLGLPATKVDSRRVLAVLTFLCS